MVVHAYREAERPGAVEVEVKRPNGYLCLLVRDHGCGLAPRTDSPGPRPRAAADRRERELARGADSRRRRDRGADALRSPHRRVHGRLEEAASPLSSCVFRRDDAPDIRRRGSGTPARAREAVREFAAEHGADADTLAAVELCVSEAVNNAVAACLPEAGAARAG